LIYGKESMDGQVSVSGCLNKLRDGSRGGCELCFKLSLETCFCSK